MLLWLNIVGLASASLAFGYFVATDERRWAFFAGVILPANLGGLLLRGLP